jgi:ABC-type polysaccharide/polyol phosphate export permease
MERPARGSAVPMIVGTVLYGIALPFLVMMAMMSPMASDAGVNTKVWTFMIAIATWPIAFVLAIALGWLFYGIRRRRAMWFALIFPWLWLVPIVWSSDFGR